MQRKTVFLFSGQGSHGYQMARGLYDGSRTFRYWMDRMDAYASAARGVSVVAELYGAHGRAEPFEDIRLTHPAIFMIELALAKTVMQLGVRPDYTLGTSLGTLAALAVSGRLSMEQALQIVLDQAYIIHSGCPRGGIIGVLADSELYLASSVLQSLSVIAGQNFPSHFVLAVPDENLSRVEDILETAGVVYQRLPVSYPFHGPWIEPVRDGIVRACRAQAIGPSHIPVICCAHGRILSDPPDDYFWRIARYPIEFMRTIAWMESWGAFNYVDVGPSGMLATSLKYQLTDRSSSRKFGVLSPFGQESMDSLLSVLAQLHSGS